MQVAYCYLMKGPPEDHRGCAAACRLLAQPRPHALAGGPFEDRSGGLIIVETPGHAQAEQLVASDIAFARTEHFANYRGVPIPRIFARFNRRIANPVMRLFARRLPPLRSLLTPGT
jgi:hypothetical protein